MSYRGRFAPSPTGPLHAGSLLTALASYLDARHAGGCWLLRMEDIDPPREVAGAAQAILADLAALGLHHDEAVIYQSQRHALYRRALHQLQERGDAFACWCSRADLAAHGGLHRDGRCVRGPDRSRAPAWRLRVPDIEIAFDDRLQGPRRERLRDSVGDFVLRRADGLWAYQLACVVDDAAQGITDIVRGRDLIGSTARQIYLQQRLGLPTPRYMHIPLLTDGRGRKLSKSTGDGPSSGTPDDRLRHALQQLGQRHAAAYTDATGRLTAASRHFDPGALPRHDLALPASPPL